MNMGPLLLRNVSTVFPDRFSYDNHPQFSRLGIRMVQELYIPHIPNTCILVLYDEIFTNLYVNNGHIQIPQYHLLTNINMNNTPVSTPVPITWVYLSCFTFLCTSCEVGKFICSPVVLPYKVC